MKVSRIHWALLTLLIPITFASCGVGTSGVDFAGGDSSTVDLNLAGGGIGGTGISVGRITAFGSVFVNGVEYATNGAIISIEGSESTSDGSRAFDESLLAKGMIVTVHWVKDASGNPVANRIVFKDNLEGLVEGVSSQTLTVLGQTVNVDGATTLLYGFTDLNRDELTDINDISVGDPVEISGFADANGIIHATYIKRKEDGKVEIEIKGTVTKLNINNGTGTFNIGSLPIIFDSATSFEDMSVSNLKDGLFVEVKSGSSPVNGVLTAAVIKAEEEISRVIGSAPEGEEIEVEGFVTDITNLYSDDIFLLNDQPVRISSDTRYKPMGYSKESIKYNVRIEVDGKIDADGVLIAEEISFESEGDGGDSSKEGSLLGSEGTFNGTSDSRESDSKSDLEGGHNCLRSKTNRINDDNACDDEDLSGEED